MNGFHDVRFPLSIGLAAIGGPERLTEVVTLASGREERNAVWAGSRRRWDVAPGVRSLDDISILTEFFEARRARLHAFRFLDPFDHSSASPTAQESATDQQIGEGDGQTTRFQLVKQYGPTQTGWMRSITHPIEGSVLVAVDGVAAAFQLDLDGVVDLDAAPGVGAVVTAGFEFDTPARFDTDSLSVTLEGARAGDAGSVPLIEVRP